jgi:hypothetical protein
MKNSLSKKNIGESWSNTKVEGMHLKTENSHKAIIKGNIVRKIYDYDYYIYDYDYYIFGHSGKPSLKNDIQKIGEETIWEGYLDMPLLKEREEIYISTLGETVKISHHVRTTENEFVYSTYHIVRTVEDEISKNSKLNAEAEIEAERERRAKRRAEIEARYKKPWYKKLFSQDSTR